MKYFLSAIALVIATPAAAQTAPAQDHQGHAQHQQHGQHQGHAQHQQPQGGQPGHAPQGDCCADRNGNGRMDCCERMAEAGDRRGCCAQPAPATPAAQPVPAAQPQRHGAH